MHLKKLFTAASLLTLSTLGALTLGGCAEDRTTLFISGVYGFEPGEGCEFDVTLGGTRISTGRLDPLPGLPYTAYLVIGNGIQNLGDNDTLRAETSRIMLQGAEISITTTAGAVAANPFTLRFAAAVHPDESEEPGVSVVGVPIVPATLGLPTGEYLVSVTLFGQTLGGLEVESGEFVFPVEILEPGERTVCDTVAALPVEALHPCTGAPQDGFWYPCGSDPNNPGCIEACF